MLTVSERFSSPHADIILRSYNGVTFRVHRPFLSEASPVFRDMLEIPQSTLPKDELPVVDLSETDDVIDALLRWIYPYPDKPTIDDWECLERYVEAACKYDMKIVSNAIKDIMKTHFLEKSPVRLYGFARWLHSVHALDTADVVLCAKRRILHTDVDILQTVDALDLKFISSTELVELLNTKRTYGSVVEKIIHIPSHYFCSSCSANWALLRPWIISNFTSGAFNSTHIPTLTTKLPGLTCCSGRITTRLSVMKRDMLNLWETGSYNEILSCWTRDCL